MIYLALGIVVLFWAWVVREALAVRRLRSTLHSVAEGMVDHDTGMLTVHALSNVLIAELDWAHRQQVGVAVTIFEFDGDSESMTERLLNMRSIMRGNEHAFRLPDGRVVAAFYDVNEHGAVLAVARMAEVLNSAGQDDNDVRAGFALYPNDGSVVADLLAIAVERISPIEDFVAFAQARPYERPVDTAPPAPLQAAA
jgi:hypothetical protein